MKTSLKAGFAQIFSSCPKNLSCPKFGGAAAPLAPPARTPMRISTHYEKNWTLSNFPAKFGDMMEAFHFVYHQASCSIWPASEHTC